MPLRIDHTHEIDAPAEVVWKVLTDFEAYGDWNPFVVAASCSLEVGAAMDMQVRVLPFMTQRQREWITSIEPGRGFCYAMSKTPGRALRSERCHEIEPIDAERCRYMSRFEIAGPVSSIVQGLLGGQLRRGFTEMSAAIQERAESLTTARDEVTPS